MGYSFPGQRVDLGGGRGWLDRQHAESIFRIDRQIGHRLQITEAGRTWDEQNAHFQTYLRVGSPIALSPDTPSVHQEGGAIDSNEAQQMQARMEDNGWRRTVYRWVNGVWTLVERWHYERFAHLDNHRNDPAPANSGATPLPQPPTEEEQIMGVKEDIVDGITRKIDGLDTRRDTAIVWVEGNAFVVDDAAGTKWNVARKQTTIEDAFAFIAWLRARGFTEYTNQAPFVLAGYRDITEEGSVREEVARALREANAGIE